MLPASVLASEGRRTSSEERSARGMAVSWEMGVVELNAGLRSGPLCCSARRAARSCAMSACPWSETMVVRRRRGLAGSCREEVLVADLERDLPWGRERGLEFVLVVRGRIGMGRLRGDYRLVRVCWGLWWLLLFLFGWRFGRLHFQASRSRASWCSRRVCCPRCALSSSQSLLGPSFFGLRERSVVVSRPRRLGCSRLRLAPSFFASSLVLGWMSTVCPILVLLQAIFGRVLL